MILLGNPSTDFNTKRIFFRSYAMVCTDTTKTLKIRRTPSIALNKYNEGGGQLFMLLYTEKENHRNDWVELSIDDEVMKREDELEKKLINNPPLTNIQCLSGHQEYPF